MIHLSLTAITAVYTVLLLLLLDFSLMCNNLLCLCYTVYKWYNIFFNATLVLLNHIYCSHYFFFSLYAIASESYLIFSGGLTADTAGRVPSITIMHGKTTTVLEMDHNIVDFVTLCESPYNSGQYLYIYVISAIKLDVSLADVCMSDECYLRVGQG